MSSSSSPCAACKFLRRKCTQGCVFSPYFPPDQPQKFANVHHVFGASNVAKLLNDIPIMQREDAVNSLAYEAEARLRDPVHGCVGYIQILQQRIKQVQHDLYAAKKELSGYIGAAALGPFIPPPSPHVFGGHAPFHQGMYGMGMSVNQQMLLREQQQQIEAQQLAAAAAVAAREQELLRISLLEQHQQNEIARINNHNSGVGSNSNANNSSSFLMGGNGGVVVTAVTGAASGSSPPMSGLHLVPTPVTQQFEGNFHVQSLNEQQLQQQQQQLQLHHQYVDQFSNHQTQHQRARSDEGRSG